MAIKQINGGTAHGMNFIVCASSSHDEYLVTGVKDLMGFLSKWNKYFTYKPTVYELKPMYQTKSLKKISKKELKTWAESYGYVKKLDGLI